MSNDIFKMWPISNPRTPDGKWKDMGGCDICGNISSAYLGVQEKGNMAIVVCKGCLLKGAGLIDETVLKQCL